MTRKRDFNRLSVAEQKMRVLTQAQNHDRLQTHDIYTAAHPDKPASTRKRACRMASVLIRHLLADGLMQRAGTGFYSITDAGFKFLDAGLDKNFTVITKTLDGGSITFDRGYLLASKDQIEGGETTATAMAKQHGVSLDGMQRAFQRAGIEVKYRHGPRPMTQDQKAEIEQKPEPEPLYGWASSLSKKMLSQPIRISIQ